MKLYIAHQMTGLSGQAVIDYYKKMTDELGEQYSILSPVKAKEFLAKEDKIQPAGYMHPVTCNHAIFERDMWMVSQCDVMLCDLSGMDRVSIGCCMELAVASWLRKHTVVVLSEPHNHAFVKEAADVVFDTLGDAMTYLRKIR